MRRISPLDYITLSLLGADKETQERNSHEDLAEENSQNISCKYGDYAENKSILREACRQILQQDQENIMQTEKSKGYP